MKKNKKIIYSLITIVVITVVTVILLPEHKKIHHANMEHSSDHDHDKKISKVNIEALRLHLVEMQDMTLNVTVEQEPIKLGFKAVITPTTNRALQSMSRVLSVHPSQMKEETGWNMVVTNNNGIFTIAVTTDQLQDVDKIRGLGYIGIMAYGNHHQPHHWAMASGDNPHSEHIKKH